MKLQPHKLEWILMKVRYDKAVIGDTFVVNNDGQKEKRQVVVTESFTYKTKYDDVMVRLTMNDGSVFYGWDYRELEDGK